MNTPQRRNMSDADLRTEINRIYGALDMLSLLRERLLMQRDELGAESAQEAVDEMLTGVDALYIEYQRRKTALSPQHRSFQFVLTDTEVYPLEHEFYVELVRGRSIFIEFAGQTLRLADWYLRMRDDSPKEVVNETYNWLVLDEAGRADLHAARAIDTSPLPSAKERDEIFRCLYSSNL